MDTARRSWILGIVLGVVVGTCLSGCHKKSEDFATAEPVTVGEPSADTAKADAAAPPPDDVDVAAGPPSDADQGDVADPPDELPMATRGDDDYATAAGPPPPPPPPEPDWSGLEEVIVTAQRRMEPPSWRTSVKERGCDECDVASKVEERKDYALDVRLTNGEEDVEGGRASDALRGVVEAIPEGEPTTLKLVPLFVDGVMPVNAEDAQPVEIVVRRPDEPGLWGRATLQLAILPNAKKCASLIVSVWDVTLTTAYDAFLVTLPVGERDKESRCPDPLHPGTMLSGPQLVSVSDVFRPPVASVAPETNDRISLYAFELPIKHNSYVFAVIDPVQGDTTVSGWKLKTPLSESFGLQATDFNKAAQRDRENMNGAADDDWIYEKTAKFIKKKLFTAEFTSGGAEPDEVFEQMRAVINRDGANANVMAQIFVPIEGSDESGLMFLPLRTLGAANSEYFKDFRFASPLPGAEEDEDEAAACVSNWKLVLNTSLAGSAGDEAEAQSSAQSAIQRLSELAPTPWRAATLTTNDAIRNFFENQDDEDQVGSTGIIVAAHYGRRSLGLEGDEIAVEDLMAYRAPHSVAVLAACETAAPTEANGIIRGLRAQNVDAFLASPLKVPTDYAIRFVESLVKQIDLAYANGTQPTLGELYSTSMDNVETASEGQRIEARNLGREFVIVGDANRRLCKLPP